MSRSEASCFVTIEGIEGSGKSTLQSRLAEYFRAQSIQTLLTREPGATELGKSIRQLVLDPNNKSLSSTAELLLFGADRAQHLQEIIRPALAEGQLVICDRFVHSTLAYQGFGRGMNLEHLRDLQSVICGATLPDLVLLLDLPVEVGLERAKNRAAGGWNRFEEQEQAFHRRVREGFLVLSQDPQNRMVIIDATQSAERICEQAIQCIESSRSVSGKR